MKKLYTLLFTVLISAFSFAQLQYTVSSPGVYQINYGSTNDYSLYNPGAGVSKFYIHTFINGADNSTGNAYQDDWANSNVVMTYDATAMAYLGTIDLNTKIFTYGNMKLPGGTTVLKVGMVFKDLQSGATKQSANIFMYKSTKTNAALGVSDLQNAKKNTFVANGKLYTKQTGNLDITVYDMTGKIVKQSQVKSSDSALELNIYQTGTYMVKVSNGSQTEVVKFIK
jgi:hypothetical protein